jgi:predicted nucleic acid-binding protein
MGQDLGGGRRRGRPRPVNDSWIAACCLAHQFRLARFNAKDFEDFAEYDGLQLVST